MRRPLPLWKAQAGERDRQHKAEAGARYWHSTPSGLSQCSCRKMGRAIRPNGSNAKISARMPGIASPPHEFAGPGAARTARGRYLRRFDVLGPTFDYNPSSRVCQELRAYRPAHRGCQLLSCYVGWTLHRGDSDCKVADRFRCGAFASAAASSWRETNRWHVAAGPVGATSTPSSV